jgi:hypothetical protein
MISIPSDSTFDSLVSRLVAYNNQLIATIATLPTAPIDTPSRIKELLDIVNLVVSLIGLLANLNLNTEKTSKVIKSILKIRQAIKDSIENVLAVSQLEKDIISKLDKSLKADRKSAETIKKQAKKLAKILELINGDQSDPIVTILSTIIQFEIQH